MRLALETHPGELAFHGGVQASQLLAGLLGA
jgi:hypothetical protein